MYHMIFNRFRFSEEALLFQTLSLNLTFIPDRIRLFSIVYEQEKYCQICQSETLSNVSLHKLLTSRMPVALFCILSFMLCLEIEQLWVIQKHYSVNTDASFFMYCVFRI